MAQKKRSFLAKWGSAIGLCLTLFVVAFNVSVIPAIMPRIVRDLDSSIGYVQAALVLLALVKASFAPTCENLIKRFGRKPVFLTGLVLFALGTIATSQSQSIGIFVVSYSLICGLGATPLISSPRELIGRFNSEKAAIYSQLVLIVSSILGGLTGAILGGLIASNFGWRWSLLPQLIIVPIIAFLVRKVPHNIPLQTEPLDWIGGLLSFLGFGLTLLGVSLAGEYGWWFPKQQFKILDLVIPPFSLSIVPLLIATGIICLSIFIAWQRQQAQQGKTSVVRLGLLRYKPFLLCLFTASLHTLITTGIQFNLYQFLPAVLNLNPFQTALAVLPFSLATLFVVILATFKLVKKVNPKQVIYSGLALFCLGIWQLYSAIDLQMKALDILPALVIMGAGSGLFLAQIGITTFSTVQHEELAEATGVYNPLQNLGNALGRGILGSVLIVTASANIVDKVVTELGKTITSAQRTRAIQVLEKVIQTYTSDERREFFSQLPAAIQPSLNPIINSSAVEAMRTSVTIAFIFSILCLISAFFIPKRYTTIHLKA
ncbi:MFS transporter [[Phormidium ambiguum] IAM M-71]|uniref:MFS transporter n=2 Tax=[Phormidium ambiguum] IAM M-71 TaxID=454136 RepID=A0A1U7IBP1_9CYAN|nr:MFS transporter [Phormidium ambiguum IAM M-71]